MRALHVRNVPESLIVALRERAEKHGRSMQQEILEILENAASQPIEGSAMPPLRLTTARTKGTTTWPREEIYSDEDR